MTCWWTTPTRGWPPGSSSRAWTRKAPIVGGEEWLGGPYPTAAWLTDMIGTLTRLTTGADPLEGVRIRTRADGQVVAGVFPSNAYDRLLLNGYELDVWMQPGVTPDYLARHGRPPSTASPIPPGRSRWSSGPATSPRSRCWMRCTACSSTATWSC